MNPNTFLDNKKIVLEYFKKHQFEKVVKFGKKLLKKNNDFQLYYALGISYFSLKNYIEAEKTFKNVIFAEPTAENYFIYGLKTNEEACKSVSCGLGVSGGSCFFISSQSTGFSAVVTYPVSSINFANCALVTSV